MVIKTTLPRAWLLWMLLLLLQNNSGDGFKMMAKDDNKPRRTRNQMMMMNNKRHKNNQEPEEEEKEGAGSTDFFVSMQVAVRQLPNCVVSALQSPPWGLLALTSVAAMVVVPLVQLQTWYGVSVGYGAAVAWMALVLRIVFRTTTMAPNLLSLAAVFHGLRLALHLVVRHCSTGYKPPIVLGNDGKPRPENSRLARLPLALLLSLLYSCMLTPLWVVVLQHDTPNTENWFTGVTLLGTALAWLGTLVEAVADAHKWLVKRTARKQVSYDVLAFYGPSSGLYALTRHPNYTGELCFWTGLYVAALPSLLSQLLLLPWLCGTCGFGCLGAVMMDATRRLEARQAQKYGGQVEFQKWKARVPYPLIPLVDTHASPKKKLT